MWALFSSDNSCNNLFMLGRVSYMCEFYIDIDDLEEGQSLKVQ